MKLYYPKPTVSAPDGPGLGNAVGAATLAQATQLFTWVPPDPKFDITL